MKTTPFLPFHLAANAKMMPFAGYNMPLSYDGIAEEHLCVRQGVGVFDVSHMGEFIVRGQGALELIQRVSSNDASRLYEGKVQYACLMNEQGGIVDDMLVYRLPDGAYMLVVNAANVEKDLQWIQQHNTENAEIIDISEKTALLAVQGPKAIDALQSLTDIDLRGMDYYTCAKGIFAGIDKVLISATGYTGAGGFELYFDNDAAETIWNAIMQAGESVGIRPVGLGARDTLRLEKGFCLYGNDIDDSTSPLEAGLGWITKFNKEFIGKDVLLAQKQQGLQRRLVGFVMQDKTIPRQGYNICTADGTTTIGQVSSGTFSPSLRLGIGMGYVPIQYAAEGTNLSIAVRQKMSEAKVVKLPFL